MWLPHPNKCAVLAATGAVLISMFGPRFALSHETLTTTVLFDREIVRILNSHCVMCHVENGPSFPLATYDQTWLQARKIRADVIARHMPPWSAFPGYGQFANDNSLTLRETQFIVSWVEGSGPRNSGRVFTNIADPNAPRPQQVRAQADFEHWQLGEPDRKHLLPANSIEPQEGDTIKRNIIDLGPASGRTLRAWEYKPGDRRVVRAAFFKLQETGQWLGSWTPWYGFMSLPKGAAWRLPAGAHIAADIYYRSAKERVVEQGTLGLFFDDHPSADVVSDIVLEAKGEVPAGQTQHKFRAVTRFTLNTDAVALWPDLLPGVQSLEVSARKPDGTTQVLLFAKDIRSDWPTPYIFKTPVELTTSTELSVIAYYTNNGTTPQPGGVRLTVTAYRKGMSRPPVSHNARHNARP
jgi:hypothetical protein